MTVIDHLERSITRMARLSNLREEKRVVVGIPNTGRLYEEGRRLLGHLPRTEHVERSLLFERDDLVMVCARSNDLPYLLAAGVVDLALTGYDYVVEAGVTAEELWDFGFQQCRICLLGHPDLADWATRPRLRVATQYPKIAAGFLARHRPDAELFIITGAAELYPRINAADVIIDAYMTGETAAANGLVPLTTLLETSGRLFARPEWRGEPKPIKPTVKLITSLELGR